MTFSSLRSLRRRKVTKFSQELHKKKFVSFCFCLSASLSCVRMRNGMLWNRGEISFSSYYFSWRWWRWLHLTTLDLNQGLGDLKGDLRSPGKKLVSLSKREEDRFASSLLSIEFLSSSFTCFDIILCSSHFFLDILQKFRVFHQSLRCLCSCGRHETTKRYTRLFTKWRSLSQVKLK